MTSIQELVTMELDIRGYSSDTKRHYLYHLARFLEFSSVSPDQLDDSNVKLYLHQLILSHQSFSWVNIAYSAIKFLFTHCLKRTWNVKSLPRPKNEVNMLILAMLAAI